MNNQAQTEPCELSLESRFARTYSEEAFHYFLSLERNRSERSRRLFLLLLVELKDQPGESARLESRIAGKLFAALQPCLRETDFIGWYREDQAAGAVLTEIGHTGGLAALIRQRVTEALRSNLPSDISSRLEVSVCTAPPPTNRS